GARRPLHSCPPRRSADLRARGRRCTAAPRAMSTLFVTGSGTDVGKTFVAELLLGQLLRAGRRACALKPVASGFDEEAPATSDPGDRKSTRLNSSHVKISY